MFAIQRKIYESLPPVCQGPLAWIPFRYLAGKSYRIILDRSTGVETASREEVLRISERCLGPLLRFAVEEVPAYQPFKEAVKRYSPREALKAFPIISKEVIQNDKERFLPRNLASIPHYRVSTGGTSGRQLDFYHDDDSQRIELAFMHRQWKRVGYSPRSLKGTFRGVDFRHVRPERRVFWQRNPVYREWQFSPFHMSESTLPFYAKHLQDVRPPFLHGYPSAISTLAQYVKDQGLPPSSFGVRAALLASEPVFPEQREIIEAAFDCRAFSWYGHSERLVLAGECEKNSSYHQIPDYGFLEMLDGEGNAVEDGELGEIVGTTFWNRSFPLIRYRTGDFARRLHWRCECGRNHDRFDNVQGRREKDYLIGRSGAKIVDTGMHGVIFQHVARYQCYQDTPGAMQLRIMPLPGFVSKDGERILTAYRRKLHGELEVELVVVKDIPLTERGKLVRIVRDIPGT